MNKTQEQLEKLREVAEASLTKTEELHKVLAQIEALMSREEMQKVSKKHKQGINNKYINCTFYYIDKIFNSLLINQAEPVPKFLSGLEV